MIYFQQSSNLTDSHIPKAKWREFLIAELLFSSSYKQQQEAGLISLGHKKFLGSGLLKPTGMNFLNAAKTVSIQWEYKEQEVWSAIQTKLWDIFLVPWATKPSSKLFFFFFFLKSRYK